MTILRVWAHWTDQLPQSGPATGNAIFPPTLAGYTLPPGGTPRQDPGVTWSNPRTGPASDVLAWAELARTSDIQGANWFGSTWPGPFPPPFAGQVAPAQGDEGFDPNATGFMVTKVTVVLTGTPSIKDFTIDLDAPGSASPWHGTVPAGSPSRYPIVVTTPFDGKGIWRIAINRDISSSTAAPSLRLGGPPGNTVLEPYVSPYGTNEGILAIEFEGYEIYPANCCDSVAITPRTVDVCLGSSGAATAQFAAALSLNGCSGNFRWRIRDAGTLQVIQPYQAGSSQFSASFASAGSYRVEVRVDQSADCDDPALTDYAVVNVAASCPPCSVSIQGPTTTPCVNSGPTAPATFTASTPTPYSGAYTWEVHQSGITNPISQSIGGANFQFSFPGPGTYQVSVSILTPLCPRPTASAGWQVAVQVCPGETCPPGQSLQPDGTCLPDRCPDGQQPNPDGSCPPPPVCPKGQHRNERGECVPDKSTVPCDALLWIAVILGLVGALLSLVGCVMAAVPVPPSTPQIAAAGVVVGIIGVVIFGVGAILFLLWWIFCRFVTLCTVILAVRDFVGWMIVVFAAIAAVLGFLALIGLAPTVAACAAASAAYGASWGVVYFLLNQLAENRGCLVRNPSGSSSSPLTGEGRGGTRMSHASSMAGGLGDSVQRFTGAMGFQPCPACQKRAQQLNELVPYRQVGSA